MISKKTLKFVNEIQSSHLHDRLAVKSVTRAKKQDFSVVFLSHTTHINVIKLVEIYSEVVQSKIKFDHVGIDCIKIVFVYRSSKSICIEEV